MKLAGKKAIVTGANRSIGQAIAVALAREGADVVISYRSDELGAMETVKKIKEQRADGKALFADFSDVNFINKFIEEAISHLGQVDILVNNAGGHDRSGLLSLPLETFEKVIKLNVTVPMLLTQRISKHMIDKHTKGNIINISSISGERCHRNRIAYGCSKGALNMLTKNCALELADHNIRVNAIAPGVVHSGMNEDTPQSDPELWKERMDRIPLRRAGDPNEIANTAVFLASDDSGWMTGQIVTVDGGHTLAY